VNVDFVPTLGGDVSATLQVPGTDGATLAQTALTGHGVVVAAPPRATLGSTSLTFAAQRVGTTSAAQSVTVTNTGGVPLTVSGVDLTGPAATSFAATPAAACATVDPGASCQVAVTFAPTATGSRTATLTVRSNDPGAAPAVALNGTGTSSIITLKSPTLDLGTAKIGQVATKTMTLTNTGTASLTITSLTTTDSTHFAVAVGTCVGAIAPGRTCNVSVTLLAQIAAGSFTTTVGFVSDAANSATLRVTATVR
jgi:uncharacterized membrane protein